MGGDMSVQVVRKADLVGVINRWLNDLLAGASIIAHLAACFLALWFHQHPGQDHAEVEGNSYHSHASSFASPPPVFGQDRHDLSEGLHLLENSSLFDKMQASIEAHFGQIIFSGKYTPNPDFLGLPSASISPLVSVVKTPLKLLPVQPTQDYFVLIASDLSPPLA
jgi:hypothetical protein